MKLVKLTVISAAALLAVTSVYADNYKGEKNYKGEAVAPCPVPLTLHDGFYVGVDAGYDSYRIRQTNDAYNPVLNATGFVGGLFLGYGRYLTDMFYLGGEVFGQWSGADVSWTVIDSVLGATTTRVDANNNYGVSLLPGIKLNDATLAYVRLGWNWASMRARETGAQVGSESSTVNGFNYGVGMESAFYENWSLRADYNHTNFGSFSTVNSRFSPADNQFLVGLIYHWM